MIILKPDQMKEVDNKAIEAGFPEIILMETAGRGVAEKARFILNGEDHQPDHDCNHDCSGGIGDKVLIIAGKGNNGGDGLVTARYLDSWGYNVKIILLCEQSDLTGSAEKNYTMCKIRRMDILSFPDIDEGNQDEIENLIYRADLVIDAMLGTGISGEVREPYAVLIDMINQSASRILSVDIPSGIDAESGDVLGNSVIADNTMTMAYPKLGMLIYPAREYCGEIEVVDLGVPVEFALELKPDHFTLDAEEIHSIIPQRPANSHKGSFGKVAVFGGTMGMSGAPCLSGKAALRTGAGLVKAVVPENIQTIVAEASSEIITVGIKGLENLLKVDDIEKIEDIMSESDVIAAGPGMGKGESVNRVIIKLIKKFEGPLILDADGINSLENPEILKERKMPTILTPHPGEMSRLINKEISEIESNRIEIARSFATEYQVYLILKGASTIIAFPDGTIYINLSGNNGMATAGSGDVLTGMLTGLLAMKSDIEDAIVLGPYLHGVAGDMAAEQIGTYSMVAGDIISNITGALKLYL
ncbi:MAG: NAD(P)H-hydrate dehydratase [Halanaerobiaceae bacterium]